MFQMLQIRQGYFLHFLQHIANNQYQPHLHHLLLMFLLYQQNQKYQMSPILLMYLMNLILLMFQKSHLYLMFLMNHLYP